MNTLWLNLFLNRELKNVGSSQKFLPWSHRGLEKFDKIVLYFKLLITTEVNKKFHN